MKRSIPSLRHGGPHAVAASLELRLGNGRTGRSWTTRASGPERRAAAGARARAATRGRPEPPHSTPSEQVAHHEGRHVGPQAHPEGGVERPAVQVPAHRGQVGARACRAGRSPRSVPPVSMGAMVQGLLVQQPARSATLLRRKENAIEEGDRGVDAQDREEGDEHADAEREGRPVRRALLAEQGVVPTAGAGSFRRGPEGQGLEVLVGAGRRAATRRSPPAGAPPAPRPGTRPPRSGEGPRSRRGP